MSHIRQHHSSHQAQVHTGTHLPRTAGRHHTGGVAHRDTFERGHHDPALSFRPHQAGKAVFHKTGRRQNAGGKRRINNAPRGRQHRRNGAVAPHVRTGAAGAAAAYGNRSFKPGQKFRCADFASTMLRQGGKHVRWTESAANLAAQGAPVSRDKLKPGDAVFFNNTWRKGKYTHVGIYLGDGKFQHRPTANKPVAVGNLNSGYWTQHWGGGRRYN